MNTSSGTAATAPATPEPTTPPPQVEPLVQAAVATATPTVTATATATATPKPEPTDPEVPDRPVSLREEVTSQVLNGAGIVKGNQINNHNFFGADARAASPDAWQDDLIEVALPPSAQDGGYPELEQHLEALLRTHVLLVRHTPTPGAEAQARTVVRAAVHALQGRQPGRQAFSSKFDRPFPPQNLCHTARWREDRQNAVFYLFRSDDPASLSFFNANVEPVRDLCSRLRQMNCYLVLTVAIPARTSLREQGALAELIALWSIDDGQHHATTDFVSATSSNFDATLGLCAALLPGLAPDEFVVLVDMLLPAVGLSVQTTAPAAVVDSAQAAPPPPEPSREQRWRQGDRDRVLAELGIALQPPPSGNDVAAGASESGLFFSDPVFQLGMPVWLYAKFPLLLATQVDALTRHYFSAAASPRYCVGYRRLLLRLDAVGARRLELSWLMACLREALSGGLAQLGAQRFAELLVEISNNGDGQQLMARCITAIAALLPEYESDLALQLADAGLLHDFAARRLTPYSPRFWEAVSERPDGAALLGQTTWRQLIVVDLLQTLAAREPTPVAAAVTAALQQSTTVHAGWLTLMQLLRQRLPALSLSRAIFRERQVYWLLHSADRWLDFAQALALVCSGSTAIPGAEAAEADDHTAPASPRRWLSRDCIVALVSSYDDAAAAPWPIAVHQALIGRESSRQRFAGMLAGLLRANALPAEDDGDFSAARDAVVIDIETVVWLYYCCAVSAVAHETGDNDQLAAIVADVLKPWYQPLRALQRARVGELARDLLQAAIDTRDALADDVPARSRAAASRAVRASQVLIRALRLAQPKTA